MTQIAPPSYSDDTGAGTDGTVLDESFLNALMTAINDLVHSTANTTIAPKATTDEVVLARGSKASLDQRLDVFLNEDGTPKGSSSFPLASQVKSIVGSQNLLANEDFLIWPAGDTSAPSYWNTGGSSATVQRTGSGLADTTRKHGKFALRITGNGATPPTIKQDVLDSAVLGFTALKGRKVSLGIRIKTTNSGVVVRISDGATTSDSAAHSASGVSGPESDGWEWLTVTHTMSQSSTILNVNVIGGGNSDVIYISGATLVIGELVPTDWVPSPRSVHTWSSMRHGALTAPVTDESNLTFHRPAIVMDVRLHVRTAPTGANLTVDVNHWDGAAFTTMFSATKVTVVAAAKDGFAQPDGTYRYRCFAGMEAGAITDAQCNWDIDTVGSGVAGSDISVQVRYMQYDRMFEGILAFND